MRIPPSAAYAGAVVAASLLALHVGTVSLVNEVVPDAYMDETLHVPQAQRYCLGDFEAWDDRITTFPGVYLWSSLVARVAAFRGLNAMTCDTATLRLSNLPLAAVVAPVALVLLRLLHRDSQTPLAAALQAGAVGLLPVHFFTAQLYYTDAGALLGVLGTLALAMLSATTHRCRSTLSSLAIGLVIAAIASAAILFRQTNAVWVSCAAALAALAAGGSVGAAAHALLPVFPPVAAFAGFALWNGGVVLGHHEHHAPVFHFAQLCYLVAVCGGYSAASLAVSWALHACSRHDTAPFSHPLVDAAGALEVWTRTRIAASGLASRLLGGRRGPALLAAAAAAFVAASALTAALLCRFSLAHPFLLADNRHYTFYIWARILGPRPALRIGLAPVYVSAGALSVLHIVGSWHRRPQQGGGGYGGGAAAAALWLFASALTLLPAHLVEPRYHIVPTALFLLLVRTGGSSSGRAVPAHGPKEGHRVERVGVPAAPPALVMSASAVKRGTRARAASPRTPKRASVESALAPPSLQTRAEAQTDEWLYWVVVAGVHITINAVTLAVFMWRPFTWPDGSVARFMW